MFKPFSLALLLLVVSSSLEANSPPLPGVLAGIPKTAKVFFKNLKDGQTISTHQKVVFGVIGLKVHPAGELIPGTGHHHLIIDAEATPEGQVVAADDKHIHFGKGQTETEIQLAPGPHTLTLQFANGAHVSYGPTLSKTIRVTVK